MSKKVLSVFSLVMINVIAVDSLRTLPISAVLGLPLIAYYLVAALTFFIPVAVIAAELASAFPHTGGLYVWIREAFGLKTAFISIWSQWVYNIVWYPTILAFIVSASSYLFAPELANNKNYILFSSVGLFWLVTILNAFGMRLSSLISLLGALFGTLLPMLLMIGLSLLWLLQGKPLSIHVTDPWLPDFTSLSNLALFPGILFGLLGMEMSAVHAEEVKCPQRDYPKALFYSTIIIFSTLVLSSLAIILVIDPTQLSMVSGLIDACSIYAKTYHIAWLPQFMALMIILGAMSSVSAWIIGPTKGLLVAAKDRTLPASFSKVNRHGAPVRLLIAQGLIFTLLCSVFECFDSINAAYWLLSVLCAQMALLVYIIMFAAAIKLRHSHAKQHRPYQLPGGNLVLYTVAGLGILCCSVAVLIGFLPPTQVPIQHVLRFEAFLIGGLFLLIGLPCCLIKRSKGRAR